jgi:hypothetical protein
MKDEEPLTQPPLSKRMRILNEYNKAIKQVGFDYASNSYRTSMRDLYEVYNPHLKRIRLWLEKKRRQERDDY